MELVEVRLPNPKYKNLKIRSTFIVMMMGLSVSMVSFLSGYSMVCISQLQTFIQSKNNLNSLTSDISLSLITSAFLIGALIGPFLYPSINAMYGQRDTMILVDKIAIICILAQLIDLSFIFLFFPRLVLGMVVGINTAILPVYLNSVSPTSMSGKMGSLNQLLNALGVLAAYTYGFLIDDTNTHDELIWRLILSMPILALVYHIIALKYIFPYDTLERHLERGDNTHLEQYCQFIYENATLDDIRKLKNANQITNKQILPNNPLNNIKIIVGVLVITSYQMSGINLFNSFTNNPIDSQNLMLYLGLIQLVGCLANGFIIDKYGRKQIFQNGQFCIIIVLCLVFISNKAKGVTSLQIFNSISILLVFIHVIVFNLSLGPICIIYCTQLIRDITPIILVFQLLSSIISLSSHFLIKYLGVSNMFMGFGVISLFLYIFLHIRMKETKGLTMKQLQALYGEKEQVNYVFIGPEDEQPEITKEYNLLDFEATDELIKTKSKKNQKKPQQNQKEEEGLKLIT